MENFNIGWGIIFREPDMRDAGSGEAVFTPPHLVLQIKMPEIGNFYSGEPLLTHGQWLIL
jgi:hypothetical protein